jgi:hypothetical protein
MRSVWEKMDLFQLWIEISDLPLELPRERDNWIMMTFIKMGYTGEELIRLNRVLRNQQVVFYWDVFDASGKALNKQFLQRRRREETWSTLIFPQERPPTKDFKLWEHQEGDHGTACDDSWRRDMKSGTGDMRTRARNYNIV